MPWQEVWTLVAIGALALLVAGALSPLEALGWWAGWFSTDGYDLVVRTATAEPAADAPRGYAVFLSGIHSVSGQTYAGREQNLLHELRLALPEYELLEVFPYSVTSRALTGQRVFAWFWRWALSLKLSRRTLSNLGGFVINIRNLWQVAVSADRRYGPIYNQGSAEMIARELTAGGYRPGSGVPVILIGYSGGGQIALGAAAYLKQMLACPVHVISLGGVMSSDPGLTSIDSLYHLYGSRDVIHRLGPLFFPGRWKVVGYSSWNQARHQGRVHLVPMGPVGHTGRGGYLDSKARLPDGTTHLLHTVAVMATIIEEIPAAPAETAPAPPAPA